MSEDARQRTITWIAAHDTPANITKDDDTTAATIINTYEKPPYPQESVFYGKGVDGIRTTKKPTSTLLPDWKREGYAYKESVPINLCCVNKQGITGDKLIWKMESDLRNIFEDYPLGSVRFLDRASPNNRDQSLLKLFSVDYVLDYKRAVDDYTSDVTLGYGMGFLWDFGDSLFIFRDRLGYLYETSANGTTTTTVDASFDGFGDDFWNGCFIYYVTGDNAGDIRYVSDFDDGTDTVTHDAFDDATADGDTFYMSYEMMGYEDGQTLIPSVSGGMLQINVAASAGNKVGYITNRTNIALSSTLYTKIVVRYKTSSNSKAKVVIVFNDASTQTVLDQTSSTTWATAVVTITTAKTIDHIRLHADSGTGNVYYDYVAIYKGTFTFPNVTKLDFNPTSRNITVEIPSAIASGNQNLGANSATVEITCDYDIETTTYSWKRDGDTDNGDIFLDVMNTQGTYPWQMLVFGNKQFRVMLDGAPTKNFDGTTTLSFREYSDTNKANETYAERFYS
jgi:hypothetical protein